MIQIRSCVGFEELDAAVQMEIATWGYDTTDIIPRKAFLVTQKIGGQVLGAFDTEIAAQSNAGRMVGFAMAMAGMKARAGQEPMPYLHSHMLAVKPHYRNQGLGYRLKCAQREEALGRGIRWMEWTFDPLEIKNAYLNIAKLGAVVRAYRANFYGSSTSKLQGGLPTDRLLAEWEMDSERVRRALHGEPAASFSVEERIEVPAAIYAWKASEEDRERARAVQQRNREHFEQAFARGLAVLGFSRNAAGDGIFELGTAESAY
jgi:predicted GNAT superfamily acetyltransferase